MSYEFSGFIDVDDVPENEDAVKKAVNIVLNDDYDEDITFTEEVDFSENGMEYYGSKTDTDELSPINYLFHAVTRKIIELYPNCSLYSHRCITNMGSDMETVNTIQLQNGKVKRMSVEWTDEWVECSNPDCDGRLVSLGELEFDREYDCDECGHHFSVYEMNELISELVEEYTVEQYIDLYK